jgi:hypothetical protein
MTKTHFGKIYILPVKGEDETNYCDLDKLKDGEEEEGGR